jgi:hypothetical protein
MVLRAARFARLHWLFAVLLLVGQFGLVLHEAQHWQPKVDGDVCQLCVHHVGQQHEVAGSSISFAITAAPETFSVVSLPVVVALAPRRAYQSRGPPLIFV